MSTTPRISIVQRMGAALKAFRFSGYGAGGPAYAGYGGRAGWYLPGARYDYRQEAGNLWENSIVLACLKWQSRTFPEAPVCVQRRGDSGYWELAPEHPLLPLLTAPNPCWDSTLLWSATLLSLALDGNSYWYKVRSRAQRVVQLLWLPPWQVEPCWPDDGSAYISHYAYRVDGRVETLAVEDVVHFRDGIDPRNYRRGLSPLAAVLREVCTDNEAATFESALLRNMGVPGVIISPKDAESEVTQEKAERIQALWMAKFTGERRGEPLVLKEPFEISNPAFSPQQLVLDKVRRIPEERITAALGIPAIVVGLGAGLERGTYSNYQQAREAAYESNIIPLQRLLASQLTRQLLPEFATTDGPWAGRERIAFDLSEVRVLREDQDNLHRRIVADFRGGVITRAEARAALGWSGEG